jgi:hypothetical protein
LSTFLSNL